MKKNVNIEKHISKNIIWNKQTIFFIQGDWDVVVIQGQSQGQKKYDMIT